MLYPKYQRDGSINGHISIVLHRVESQNANSVPSKLTKNADPESKGAEINNKALPAVLSGSLDGLGSTGLIHHTSEVICFRLISSLSDSLLHARLTGFTDLRIKYLEFLTVALVGRIKLRIGLVIFLRDIGGKGAGKQMLIAKTLGAK